MKIDNLKEGENKFTMLNTLKYFREELKVPNTFWSLFAPEFNEIFCFTFINLMFKLKQLYGTKVFMNIFENTKRKEIPNSSSNGEKVSNSPPPTQNEEKVKLEFEDFQIINTRVHKKFQKKDPTTGQMVSDDEKIIGFVLCQFLFILKIIG